MDRARVVRSGYRVYETTVRKLACECLRECLLMLVSQSVLTNTYDLDENKGYSPFYRFKGKDGTRRRREEKSEETRRRTGRRKKRSNWAGNTGVEQDFHGAMGNRLQLLISQHHDARVRAIRVVTAWCEADFQVREGPILLLNEK